jgi:hypothetical protein
MGRIRERFTVYGATGYLGDRQPKTFREKGVKTMSIKPLLPPQVNDEERSFAQDSTVWGGFERDYDNEIVEPLLPTGFQRNDNPAPKDLDRKTIIARVATFKRRQDEADRRGILMPTGFNLDLTGRHRLNLEPKGKARGPVEPLLPPGIG